MMRYLLLIYQDEVAHSQWNQEQLAAEYQAYNEFTESVAKSGALQSGEPLMPTNTATTVRVRNSKTLTSDGPFAETKEQLGGYYLVNCKDLDAAIALADGLAAATDAARYMRP